MGPRSDVAEFYQGAFKGSTIGDYRRPGLAVGHQYGHRHGQLQTLRQEPERRADRDWRHLDCDLRDRGPQTQDPSAVCHDEAAATEVEREMVGGPAISMQSMPWRSRAKIVVSYPDGFAVMEDLKRDMAILAGSSTEPRHLFAGAGRRPLSLRFVGLADIRQRLLLSAGFTSTHTRPSSAMDFARSPPWRNARQERRSASYLF